MSTLIKLRRDSASNWAAADPVLALGEPGYDTTNNELRIGDGTTAWSGLTPIEAGAANTGNVIFDNYNLYNVNGGQIVISNLSYVDEVETAYIQIPAGNSASDLSITQEQGNVAINANGNIWTFGGAVPDALYWPDGSFQATAFVGAATTAEGLANVGNANITVGNVGNTFSWTFDNSGNITLPSNSASINYANGSPYGGGGGGGNTGNVTFDDVTIQGDNSVLNLSTGPDFSANLQFFRVRAGDVPSHIHFDSGDNSVYDLFIGDDSKFLQVSNSGNIILQANDSVAKTFTFDTTGNLILPDNSVIREGTATNPGGSIGSVEIVPGSQFDPTQRLVVYPTALEGNHLHLTSGNIAVTDIMLGDDAQFIKTNTDGGMTIGANTYWSGTEFIGQTWTFDTVGNLTIPANGAIQTPVGSNGDITLHADGTGEVVIQTGAATALRVTADVANAVSRVEVDTFGSNVAASGGAFIGTYARGTPGVLNGIQTDDRMAVFGGKGYGDTSYTIGTTGRITVDAAENFTDSAHGTHISVWTTEIGNTVPVETARFGAGKNLNLYAGNLTVGNGFVRTAQVTVSNLPTPFAGARSFVTDADTRIWGNLAVGSAANAVPVWADGSNWYIG